MLKYFGLGLITPSSASIFWPRSMQKYWPRPRLRLATLSNLKIVRRELHAWQATSQIIQLSTTFFRSRVTKPRRANWRMQKVLREPKGGDSRDKVKHNERTNRQTNRRDWTPYHTPATWWSLDMFFAIKPLFSVLREIRKKNDRSARGAVTAAWGCITWTVRRSCEWKRQQ